MNFILMCLCLYYLVDEDRNILSLVEMLKTKKKYFLCECNLNVFVPILRSR